MATKITHEKIKGFLFDVDGVLYDSMPQHAKSWAVAFKDLGLTLPAKPVYACEGMTEVQCVNFLASAIHTKLTRREQKEMVEKKREAYNDYANPKYIPGAIELLEFLRKRKIKRCLVTGSEQLKTIKNVQKDFHITRASLVTGGEVKHGKPHPEPYLLALKKLKLLPSEAIAVENAPLGITSAKRAGLTCVALKTGLLTARELKKYGADIVYKDCAELLSHINEFFGLATLPVLY